MLGHARTDLEARADPVGISTSIYKPQQSQVGVMPHRYLLHWGFMMGLMIGVIFMAHAVAGLYVWRYSPFVIR